MFQEMLLCGYYGRLRAGTVPKLCALDAAFRSDTFDFVLASESKARDYKQTISKSEGLVEAVVEQ